MEREVIFRGKRLDNGQWLYGDLMHDNHQGRYVYPNDCTGLYTENKVDPDTVGEFTGMTDKNGVKIFEGDIVHWKSPYRYSFTKAVGHDDAYGRFTPMDIFMGYDCEVLGNIYDNPELLSTK